MVKPRLRLSYFLCPKRGIVCRGFFDDASQEPRIWLSFAGWSCVLLLVQPQECVAIEA